MCYEFSLYRDSQKKESYYIPNLIKPYYKEFDHIDGMVYRVTRRWPVIDRSKMIHLSKDFFSNMDGYDIPEEVKAQLFKSKKELTHTEEILTGKGKFDDRAWLHMHFALHLSTSVVATVALADEIYVLGQLTKTTGVLYFKPTLASGHVAKPEEQNMCGLSKMLFSNAMKEAEEETSLELNSQSLKSLQDNRKRKPYHVHPKTALGLRLNTEDVYVYYTHLQEEQLKQMVANKGDGVEGFALMKLNEIPDLLNGTPVSFYDLNRTPFKFEDGTSDLTLKNTHPEFIKEFFPKIYKTLNELVAQISWVLNILKCRHYCRHLLRFLGFFNIFLKRFSYIHRILLLIWKLWKLLVYGKLNRIILCYHLWWEMNCQKNY